VSVLEANNDHQGDARDALLEQFKTLPNIQAVIDAASAQSQELDLELLKLAFERTLDTAEGVNLDVIGSIIGRERPDLDDDQYRSILRGQVLANLSRGTIEDIIGVIAAVYAGAATVQAVEEYPAAGTVTVVDVAIPPGVGPFVASLLRSSRATGFRWLFHYYERTRPFFLDGYLGSRFDSTSYFWTTAIEGT